MEGIAAAFLQCLKTRFHMFHCDPWIQIRGVIYDLQDRVEEYTGAVDGKQEVDKLAAEELVQALYSERSLIAMNDPYSYAKILEHIWHHEDREYFSSSSLINGLVLEALLALCHNTISRRAGILGLQNMFVKAKPENKKILVSAVFHTLSTSPKESFKDMTEVWNTSIVACIGKSALRMEVVESVLIEQSTNDRFLGDSNNEAVLNCIKSLLSLQLRQVIWTKFVDSGGKEPAYLKLFHDVAKADTRNIETYISYVISLLKLPTDGPKMEMQSLLYDAIDSLKANLTHSIYEEPLSCLRSLRND